MIVHYCDGCGKKMAKSRSLNTFSYLCHMEDYFTHKCGYVDNDGNHVSGRSIAHELCAECYNRVMIESVKKLKEIQSINNVDDLNNEGEDNDQ